MYKNIDHSTPCISYTLERAYGSINESMEEVTDMGYVLCGSSCFL